MRRSRHERSRSLRTGAGMQRTGRGTQRTGRGTQSGISSQASLGSHEDALGVLNNDLTHIFEKLGSVKNRSLGQSS